MANQASAIDIPGANSGRDPVLVAAVVLAAGLRLAFLGHKSLWLDEAATYSLCHLPWREFFRAWWAHEANMTAYYALERLWLHLGTSEWMLRLPSALFGIASVAALYAVTNRLLSRDSARIAALLLSVNPTHLEYSQEARSYAMAVFLVIAATWLLVRAVASDRWHFWIGYLLVGGLSVYAHFFAALVLAAHFLALVIARRSIRWPRALLAFAALAVLCAPGIAFVALRGGTIDLYWLPPLSARSIFKLAPFYTGSGAKLIVASILFVAGLVSLLRLRRPNLRWTAALLLLWIGFPIAVALLASLHHNVFSYKYLLVSLPPVLAVCATGAMLLRRELRWLLLVVLVVASLWTDAQWYHKPREDWRALNRFVAASYEEGDAITFYPPYARNPFDYYHARTGPATLQILAPTVIAGDLGADVYDIDHPEAMLAGAHPRRLWVVLYGTDKMPPGATHRANDLLHAIPSGLELVSTQEFHNLRLQLYAP